MSTERIEPLPIVGNDTLNVTTNEIEWKGTDSHVRRGVPELFTTTFGKDVQFLKFNFGLRSYVVKMGVFENFIKMLSEEEV